MLEVFLARMSEYLSKEDYQAFLEYFNNDVKRDIRVNPLRISVEDFMKISFFDLQPTKISKYHFHTTADLSGNHPYHLAGLYYMQESSAGSAVEAMHIKKGDIVLDLCSAPGGKSTQIAGYLNHQGLLISNEYISNRSLILLSNFERMGVDNGIITNAHPTKLCNLLQGFCDKVLVDAPCSGEGMFHKNPEAITHWSLEHVKTCHARQLEILNDAYKALRENGELVYSTCTFSKEENEEVVIEFLNTHEDMELIDCDVDFGRYGFSLDKLAIKSDGYNPTYVRRIYPMDGGEGHFIARLRKKSASKCLIRIKEHKKVINKLVFEFLDTQLVAYDPFRVYINNEDVYYLPTIDIDLPKIKVLRKGLLIGTIKANLFKPHHNFYMGFNSNNYKQKLSLTLDDIRLNSYLKGNEINYESNNKGYVAICVDDFVVGFGKISNNIIKNHYPKGLRLKG